MRVDLKNGVRMYLWRYAVIALLLLAVGTMHASQEHRLIQVRAAKGEDLAKTIQQADERLGKVCGRIVVLGNSSTSEVKTPIHLSRCHDLELQLPVVWSAQLLLHGSNRVASHGSKAIQIIRVTGAWMTAVDTSGLEISNLETTWPTVVGGDNGNRILLCRACTDIFIHDTKSSGGGYIKTDSTANTFAEVTAANSSYRIHAARNTVDGRTGPKSGVQGAWYSYTWNVDDTGSAVSNAGLAFSWWGGNNNTDWLSFDQPKKAGRMRFTGESVSNVVAGWWGSMSQDIAVTAVHGDGCEDVCLDSEGDHRVSFHHFFVTGAGNGELATFFHSQNITFGDGEVLHRDASKGFGYFNNNATNDSTKSGDVSIERVNFRCGDRSGICAIFLDPLGHLTIRDSFLDNTRIRNSVDAPEQGDVSFLSNTFTVSKTMPTPGNLLNLTTRGYGAAEICGNTFRSLVAQPVGTSVIFADNRYNLGRAGPVTIAGNIAENHFADYVVLRSAGGPHPTLLIQQNRFDSSRVHIDADKFRSVERNEAGDPAVASDCRRKALVK